MLRQAFLLLNLSLLSSLSVDDQYCSLRYRRLCQGKGSHVACQFPIAGPGPLCRNYSRIKFTSDLRHFVVHYINRRRQRIASGHEHVRGGALVTRPQIMMLVNWDRELADLAQRLADQCEFAHDECRATVRYPYAGQSVGEVRWRVHTSSGNLTFQRAIRRILDAWWGEKRRVMPEQLTAPFKPTAKGTIWGHFSQLAVWTLQAVGCGAVSHGHRNIRLLLVCDFSHTNMLGQKTLNPGLLAPCPPRTVRKSRTAYPLLCAPVRRPVTSIYGKSDDDYEENVNENNNNDKYVEVKKPTSISSSLTTSKEIHVPSYIETTEIFYEDYDPEELKVTLLPNRIHLDLGKTNHPDLEMTMKYETIRLFSANRPHYAKFRDDMEGVSESATAALKKLTDVYEDDINKLQHIRKSTRQESILRERLRNRPPRPGAKALLKKTPEKIQHKSGFLMLDQDDLDQFFRDTGFHVNWRKKPVE